MIRHALTVAALATFGTSAPLAFASTLSSEDIATRAAINQETADLDAALSSDKEDHHGYARVCRKVKLSDDQKTQLKDAIFDYKKERITLAAEMKQAKLEYARVVFSSTGQRADADAASSKIVSTSTKISEAKTSFANKVLFDIVSADQRQAAFLCMKALSKRHHHDHDDDHPN